MIPDQPDAGQQAAGPGSSGLEAAPEPGSSPPDDSTSNQEAYGEDVLVFKRSHVYMALLPLAFVVGLAMGFLLWGGGRMAQTSSDAAPLPAQGSSGQSPFQAQAEGIRLEISVDDDPALGPEDAPVTIVEFSDFNCPYCRRFHQDTFQALLDAYPDQIRFVYRDYPITSQESFYAAQAAQCAADQDAYWPFHNALFSSRYGLGREAYQQYAQELGLDGQGLLECLDSGRYAQEVESDARYAAQLGVSGTPTFFINGIPLVGAQPLSEFTRVIDSELR